MAASVCARIRPDRLPGADSSKSGRVDHRELDVAEPALAFAAIARDAGRSSTKAKRVPQAG